MRKKVADALFSAVRLELLEVLLLHPKRSWYLTELVRYLKRVPSQLHGELHELCDASVLTKRVEGRQVYFSRNAGCPFLSEIQSLLRKLISNENLLRQVLWRFEDDVKIAFSYGDSESSAGITLVAIGEVNAKQFISAFQKVRRKFGRTIRALLYTEQEFVEKYFAKDTEVRLSVEAGSKRILIGSKPKLRELLKQRSS